MNKLETGQQLLPDDLIGEILSYLSMPAISKFRCVSKSWINIIDSSTFKELHLRNHCNTPTMSSSNNDSCVFVPDFDYTTKILKITMLLSGCHRLRREFSLDEDFGGDFDSDTCIEMVGPVNGLICIYGIDSGERLALCNPYLGETETLPRAPTTMTGILIFHRVGLGFDPFHKDIRVVRLLCYVNITEGKFTLGMVVHVYSRNTNTWTILEGSVPTNMCVVDPIAISDNDGLFCHWVALLDHNNIGGSKFAVLSFDVCNEVFHTTLLPPCISDTSKVEIKFFGKGHSLILCSWIPGGQGQLFAKGGNFLGMWVLNDLGKGGRWTWWLGIGPLLRLSRPVGLWKSSGLILNYVEENRHVIFDCSTYKITNMDINDEDDCNLIVIEFRGSLVSICK